MAAHVKDANLVVRFLLAVVFMAMFSYDLIF